MTEAIPPIPSSEEIKIQTLLSELLRAMKIDERDGEATFITVVRGTTLIVSFVQAFNQNIWAKLRAGRDFCKMNEQLEFEEFNTQQNEVYADIVPPINGLDSLIINGSKDK